MRPGWSALLALAILGCTPQPPTERIAGRSMGTTFEVVVTHRPETVTRADLESAVGNVLDEVDRHLSGWNPRSDLVRFNRVDSTDWVAVPALLAEAVEQTLAVSRDTDGAFDVTVSPLVRAWGFGSRGAGEDAAPDAADLDRLGRAVGYPKLASRVHPPALRKSEPALEIDLDGIAPGIAVDRIAGRLEALGIRDYLVELGGEVRARGRSAAGRPWRVAIEAPLEGQRQPYTLVEIDGLGVSTSGDYRDFRDVDGRRISHTIDPRTAAPVAHGLASVTVLHRSAAAADAWATALMVLGPDEGMALARRRGLAALFMERRPDGSLVDSASPAFEQFRRPLARAL